MRNFNVELKELYPVQGGSVECVLADNPWDQPPVDWRRPAVIVVPGGAYQMVSRREGMPIASWFFARGYQVFILTYLCRPDGVGYPEQLIELGCAVDYVKKNAESFKVNPDEVFVVGFSAGGHLTGNLAVEYASISPKAGVELDCKPTAVCLSYPVISQKTAYKGSHENILWQYTDEAKEELLKTLNLDEGVTKDTTPAFIWTTFGDTLVPCQNSLRFAHALAENGVLFELHIYPKGQHGASTGSAEINAYVDSEMELSDWLGKCANFFRSFCVEKY